MTVAATIGLSLLFGSAILFGLLLRYAKTKGKLALLGPALGGGIGLMLSKVYIGGFVGGLVLLTFFAGWLAVAAMVYALPA